MSARTNERVGCWTEAPGKAAWTFASCASACGKWYALTSAPQLSPRTASLPMPSAWPEGVVVPQRKGVTHSDPWPRKIAVAGSGTCSNERRLFAADCASEGPSVCRAACRADASPGTKRGMAIRRKRNRHTVLRGAME